MQFPINIFALVVTDVSFADNIFHADGLVLNGTALLLAYAFSFTKSSSYWIKERCDTLYFVCFVVIK